MPISSTGPIRISDILTVKGFRRSPCPSYNFFLGDVVTTRSPAAPTGFAYLFTQNRKVGPDDSAPHALSEWRGVGNEVSGLPSAVSVTAAGTAAITVTWTNGDASASTALLLYRRTGFVVDPDPGDPGLYTLAGTWLVAPGVTSHTFTGIADTGRYKVAASHFVANTSGGDNNTGFQSGYVMSGNQILVTGSGVPVEDTGGEHPFAFTLLARTYDDVGLLYRGFQSANRCSQASEVSVTVYSDAADFVAGLTLYAAPFGPELAPLATTGIGSGPYYRVPNGTGGTLSFSINNVRVVQNDIASC